MGLARPCDTRWISHYKTLINLLKFFLVTIEVLKIVEKDAEKQAEASGFVKEMRTFNFVFICHLMHKSLGITYDLSQALQRKSQDVVNVIVWWGLLNFDCKS
jgi:hypothetical protein